MQRKLCSLADALDALGQNSSQIHELVGRGVLRLYVNVPADVLVLSIDIQDALPIKAQPLHGNPPYPPTVVDSETLFLEMDAQRSEAFMKTGIARQSIFSFALTTDLNGDVTRTRAPVPTFQHENALVPYKSSFLSGSRRFVTYSMRNLNYFDDSARWDVHCLVEITKENVYVQHADLSKTLEDLKSANVDFSLDIPLIVENYTSKKLVALRAVLLELWGAAAAQGRNVPSSGSTAQLLVDRYHFSKNHAKHGATIIHRASFKIHQDGSLHLSAPELEALIDCSDYWKQGDFNDRSLYPRNNTIKAELTGRYNFPEYLADAGVGILRPEIAAKVGRPKG